MCWHGPQNPFALNQPGVMHPSPIRPINGLGSLHAMEMEWHMKNDYLTHRTKEDEERRKKAEETEAKEDYLKSIRCFDYLDSIDPYSCLRYGDRAIERMRQEAIDKAYEKAMKKRR